MDWDIILSTVGPWSRVEHGFPVLFGMDIALVQTVGWTKPAWLTSEGGFKSTSESVFNGHQITYWMKEKSDMMSPVLHLVTSQYQDSSYEQ